VLCRGVLWFVFVVFVILRFFSIRFSCPEDCILDSGYYCLFVLLVRINSCYGTCADLNLMSLTTVSEYLVWGRGEHKFDGAVAKRSVAIRSRCT
jgi:hypothetical protein